jgi:TolB protein
LSYVGTPDEGIQLYNFESGESHQISSSVGSPAVWSPDGQSILTRDRHLAVRHGAEGENHQDHSHEFSEGVALFVTQLAALDTTRLGGDDGADDGPPAWSADGAWIAFGRKSSRAEDGRQLWVIKPDGSQARALTESPELHHGAISWSADGSTLLFQRFDTRAANQRPGIWLLNVGTGRTEELHTPGFQPAWIP